MLGKVPSLECLRRGWHRDVRTRPPTQDEARRRRTKYLRILPQSLPRHFSGYSCTGYWVALFAVFIPMLLRSTEKPSPSPTTTSPRKIDPGFHVLRSFGTVILRNDSDKPQHIAVLQSLHRCVGNRSACCPTVSNGAHTACRRPKKKNPAESCCSISSSPTPQTSITPASSLKPSSLCPPMFRRAARRTAKIAYSGVIEPSTGALGPRWDAERTVATQRLGPHLRRFHRHPRFRLRRLVSGCH